MGNEPTVKDQAARADAAQAVRFMVIKAAVFILIPVLVSAVMVWWKLG